MTYKKWKCPCCGYYTFDSLPDATYDICPVCFWEDDGRYDMDDIYVESGANSVSLMEARENFERYGACTEDMIKNVRRADEDELTGNEWEYPSFDLPYEQD